MSANQSKCRSCGAAILWVGTVRGKSIPLDAEPHEDGNVTLLPTGSAMVLTAELVASGKRIGSKRYRSHFATCAHAVKHRKTR